MIPLLFLMIKVEFKIYKASLFILIVYYQQVDTNLSDITINPKKTVKKESTSDLKTYIKQHMVNCEIVNF